MKEPREGKVLACSFCKKDSEEVRKLIAGPGVHICDECVDVCVDIIADPAPMAEAAPGEHRDVPWAGRGSAVRCALCGMPCVTEDVLLVEGKGVLCRPCVSQVEALSAEDKWAR